MKNNNLVLVTITAIAVGVLFSCKKKEDEIKKEDPPYSCTSCNTTPEASSAYDASNKGVYKGVIIGSSGTIKFALANNDTTITAVMVLDGITTNLTSTVKVVSGQTYIAPFTGVLNGQAVSINFSVDATGQNPVITSSTIPGHPNSTFTLLKETSSALIECFEGNYSTTRPETGTFNMVLSRTLKKYKGSSRKTGGTPNAPFTGTINANNELIDDAKGTNIGKISGDNFSNSFVDGAGSTVTINGKRTF